MSPVLTRLSQFCWLFVPCLVFFCLLFGWYFFNSNVIANALVNLWWTSYVSLAIAAMIAWQFGRSRLVYACLLLLLIAGDKELGLTAQLLDIRFSGILLGFIFLLYSKDKGFSALNLFFSLAILLMLFSLCGLALAPLQLASQSWLTTIDSLLFQLSPDIRALIPPLMQFYS